MIIVKMNKIVINVATDFTEFPWARFKKDWDYSWEEFFDKFLSDFDIDKLDRVEINLDWTYWYPSSFLSEAFNKFYKKYWEKWWSKLFLISKEDPSLIDFISHLVKKDEK